MIFPSRFLTSLACVAAAAGFMASASSSQAQYNCPGLTGRYIFTEQDGMGDGDGLPEPGETGFLALELLNTSDFEPLTTGTVGLSAFEESVQVLDDQGTYDYIGPRETLFNTDDPFLISIGSEMPCGPIDLSMYYFSQEAPECGDGIQLQLGAVENVLYSNNFDSPPDNTTLTDLWHWQTGSFCTVANNFKGTTSNGLMAFNNEARLGTCDYQGATSGSLEFDLPVSIPSAYDNALLSFWSTFETDFSSFELPLSVQVATTPGEWVTVWSNSGYQTWRRESVDLSSFTGQDVYLRFHFDASAELDKFGFGWYVDDIRITAFNNVCEDGLATPTPTPTPLPPCPTGTPIPVTPTIIPATTAPPTATPTVTVAKVLEVSATDTEIQALHTGLLGAGRSFIGFWSLDLNDFDAAWQYYGFVEYFPGQTTTTMPWSPVPSHTYRIAARLWVDGLGWVDPHVYGYYTQLAELTYPEVLDISYDEANAQAVVSIASGSLPAAAGFWFRPVEIPPTSAPPQPVQELSPWFYEGLTVIPANAAEVTIPFDRFNTWDGVVTFEIASRLHVKESGWSGDYALGYAPDTVVAYPKIIDVWMMKDIGKAVVQLSPVGNMPARVGLWFREIDPLTCEPLCEWTYMGMQSYEPHTRSVDFEWYAANPAGTYQGAARIYVDDGTYRGWASPFTIAGDPCIPVGGETFDVVGFNPYPGALSVDRLVVEFSEPPIQNTIDSASFYVKELDLNDNLTTPVMGTFNWLSATELEYQMGRGIAPGRYILVITDSVASSDETLPYFSKIFYVGADIFWRDGTGNWTDMETDGVYYWDPNRLPTVGDTVMVDSPYNDATITYDDTDPGNSINGAYFYDEVVVQSGSTLDAGFIKPYVPMEVMDGATLRNAQIFHTDDANLELTWYPGGTLEDVSLDGVGTMPTGSSTYNVVNSLYVNGLLRSNAQGVRILAQPNDGTAFLEGAGMIFMTVPSFGVAPAIVTENFSTLIFGPDLKVMTNSLEIGTQFHSTEQNGTILLQENAGFTQGLTFQGTIVNNGDIATGLISAGFAPVTFASGSLENNGMIAVGQRSRLVLNGPWTNNGTIQVVDSALEFLDATDTQLATVDMARSRYILNGTYTSNSTLNLDVNEGRIDVTSGAKVVGGTFASSQVAYYVQASDGASFDGVTFNARLFAIGNIEIMNGITMNSQLVVPASTTVSFPGSAIQTIGGTGQISLSGSAGSESILALTSGDTGSFVIGPDLTVTGAGGIIDGAGRAFTNQGEVISASGGVITLKGSGWNNEGILRANSGNSISAEGAWTNNGTVFLEPSSNLISTSNYTATQSALYRVEAKGNTLADHGQIQVSGNAVLDGSLVVDLINGWVPNIGDSITILQATGDVSGSFASVTVNNLPGSLIESVSTSGSSVVVTFQSNAK